MAEQDMEAILGIGIHDWFVPAFIGRECCRKCGIMRRADDRNKPCRGKVVLSLRDEYTDSASREGDRG